MAALIVVDTLLLLIEHTTNLKTHFDMYNTTGDSRKTIQHLSLLAAIDYNQLVFFLMGNLFTGMINLSMNTLMASEAVSMTVILCYMLTLSVLSLVLKHYNVALLWCKLIVQCQEIESIRIMFQTNMTDLIIRLSMGIGGGTHMHAKWGGLLKIKRVAMFIPTILWSDV